MKKYPITCSIEATSEEDADAKAKLISDILNKFSALIKSAEELQLMIENAREDIKTIRIIK
jgi:hypothetical protein